ncbi:MAG: PAS domain-containing protein [Verrucomicrobiota bacterium]|nr:PAS domain-containing protein [Verrucomicrobiota bacterium]
MMRLATQNQASDPLPTTLHLQPKVTHENRRTPSPGSSSPRSEYLALAARATNDAIRDWDVNSSALTWPQGLESLLGFQPDAVSADISFWQKQIHPEDRVRTVTGIREALTAGEQWSGEYRFRRADGVYIHLLERAVIVRDEAEGELRFVGSLMDITPRKQLQDQLIRSQKMEAFGQLAGGVAHDFNNFLTTILGYSDLLLNELGLKGPNAKHVGEIRNAAKRASALTSQLLAFSRKQALEGKVVEVNSIITNAERSVLRLLGENISVECHLHSSRDPAHVRVDPAQLTQIILNLAVNARDAMPDGGRLTFGTSTVRIGDEKQPAGCAETLAAGEYALISITDNGAGMSDEVKAHLFEPFFTTKDEGRGSGLGLATSYGIVRQSGGHLCVQSQLGKGTMVSIYLPKVPTPVAPNYKKPGVKKLATGTETVLVLEDDISVRHISVRVLRSLGYDVMEAANGDDAQRMISYENAKKVDLLLTDMVMPQMSGRDFADWLRQTSPKTKVVFISGYLEESLQLGQRCGQEMFFLAKPFDPEQLAMKVREALDC